MAWHPLLVHLPIGILLGSWAMLLWGLIQDGRPAWPHSLRWLLLGGASLLPALFSGQQVPVSLSDNPPWATVYRNHELLAYGLIWLMGLLLLWMYLRGRTWKAPEAWAFWAVFTLACGLMVAGAHLGGQMVHVFGVK